MYKGFGKAAKLHSRNIYLNFGLQHPKINFGLQHPKINFGLQHPKINFGLQHPKINFFSMDNGVQNLFWKTKISIPCTFNHTRSLHLFVCPHLPLLQRIRGLNGWIMRYFEPFIPLLVVVDFTKIWQKRPSLTNPFSPPIRCTSLRPFPFSTTDQGFERMDCECITINPNFLINN